MSKTNRRAAKMSAEQTLYAIARATFETIDAEYKTAIALIPIARATSEADYLAACDQHDAIADRLGRGKAREAMLAAAGPQLFQYSDGSFAVYQADSTHPDGFSILTPSVAVPTGGAPGPGWPPGQVIIEG